MWPESPAASEIPIQPMPCWNLADKEAVISVGFSAELIRIRKLARAGSTHPRIMFLTDVSPVRSIPSRNCLISRTRPSCFGTSHSGRRIGRNSACRGLAIARLAGTRRSTRLPAASRNCTSFAHGNSAIVGKQLRRFNPLRTWKFFSPVARFQFPVANNSPRPSRMKSFWRSKSLVLEGEPAIEILELIVLPRKSSGKQMASLQPQRSRSCEVNLKCEIELGWIPGKMELLDLIDQEPEKFLLRAFIRTSTGYQSGNDRKSRWIN